MEENEKWADIIGGGYQASTLGNIKNSKTGKHLKPGKQSKGYFIVSIFGKTKYVHRLVWEAFNGPTDSQIDHRIEGNKTDNRLENLQVLTNRQNVSKHYLTTPKTSQFTGVYWSKHAQKWTARIRVKGKLKNLGYFSDESVAADAYKIALDLLVS